MTFHGVPGLFTAVKLAGAGYLVWLGVVLIRAQAAVAEDPDRAGRRALHESVAVEVLNPGTAIFFLAFLPQFVDASGGAPVWLQLLALGTVVNLILSAGEVLVVVLAGYAVTRWSGASRGLLLARRLGGSVLIGLALHLALADSLV